MKNPGLKAILFDMDGVITLTMPQHFRVWAHVFKEAGVPVSRFDVYAREGQKGIDSVFEIFAERGREITPAEAQRMLARKEKLFKAGLRTRFVPGARSFIKKHHQSGMKLALVTGTARHEIRKILPANLIKCFDVIISGNDVRNGKPHPEPYLKALKALKVDRGEAVVIENAPFGITSALKAGLKCIAIETSLPKEYLKQADIIVQDYHGLKKAILTIR